MFQDNLQALRKMHHMSQQELAEKLSVSRQTLSKWETGESSPDLEKSRMLADIFDVSLDELTETSPDGNRRYIPPRGKHAFGVVRVGEKGQIVIPAKARKIFDIQPGDNLILLGDEATGLAMIKETEFMQMVADFTAQPFMEEEP